MYSIQYTGQFKHSLKKCAKRGLDVKLLTDALDIGNYKECWECHLVLDWLLVWKQNDKELILIMVDTGTHSDLF